MKRLCYLSFLILTFACDTEHSVSPDFNNYFVKYFGADGNQQAVDAYLDTDDQTVMILGSSVSYDDHKQIYLAKVDYDGKAIWEKIYGKDDEDPKDIEKGIDGNYVILSNYKSNIKLLRISSDGTLQDTAVYDSKNRQFSDSWGNSVTPVSDGSYLVTGYTTDTHTDTHVSQGNDKQDIITFHFLSNLSFDTRYDFSLGGQTEGEGIKVFEHDPNLFYLMGYSDDTGDSIPSNLNFYFNYIADSLGLVGYGPGFTAGNVDSLETAAFAVQSPQALNQDFFVVGTQKDASSGTEVIYFTKLYRNISTQANTSHIERIGRIPIGANADNANFEGIACAPSVVSPPGFLITAHRASANGTTIWLAKVDQNGTQLWSQTFGFEGNANLASSVVELPDGKIILLGTIGLNGQQKISLIKLNSTGALAN